MDDIGRKTGKASEDGSDVVVALDRGLAILDRLARGGGATLSEVSRDTKIPVSTTFRLLSTMRKRGFVEFSESAQGWFVGTQAFSVGNAYLSRINVVEVAHPFMRELMERSGETVNLAIENNGEVVFICQVEANNPVRVHFKSGSRAPMHASGIGKVLLAHMPDEFVKNLIARRGLEAMTEHTITSPEQLFAELRRIRDNGWALDDEERFVSMRCIAAPIFDPIGNVVAGVSISGLATRLTPRELDRYRDLVLEASRKIVKAIDDKSHE
ncbi:IclR family transcriptional regulator [Nitratireductor sp. XY-223]|uniref:IclR family transcriptional regulator n=1 Tax=Nitratireductor sp. XY-223 TaxID=2561926 RepID=UPI00145A961C|nr:IclR family transcriptional regulator [Nitratireductor sp. XY-223]